MAVKSAGASSKLTGRPSETAPSEAFSALLPEARRLSPTGYITPFFNPSKLSFPNQDAAKRLITILSGEREVKGEIDLA